MKEEWLMPTAVVPVDSKTTAALVNEVKRLIGVVGSMALAAAERDQARELLERCETEMRYAGWTKYESDNPARHEVYEEVKEFLARGNT